MLPAGSRRHEWLMFLSLYVMSVIGFRCAHVVLITVASIDWQRLSDYLQKTQESDCYHVSVECTVRDARILRA